MSGGFFHEGDLVGVLTTQPLDRVLDYKAPEGGCHLGAFVEVPLGPRKVLGVVWGKGAGDFDYNKVRSVVRVLDVAPMADEMQQFLQKAADYTLTPMSAMLRLATRAPGLGDAPSMRKVYRLGSEEPSRMTEARTKVLDVLREYGGLAFTLKEVADTAGVTSSVVKGLVKLGAVSEEDSPRDLPYPRLDPAYGSKELTEDQLTGAMTERRRCWRMVGQGDAQLVVGARSALFLPFRDLGLIVVDEEHDTSYKQEDGVLYNARDMTVLPLSTCGLKICPDRAGCRPRCKKRSRRGWNGVSNRCCS